MAQMVSISDGVVIRARGKKILLRRCARARHLLNDHGPVLLDLHVGAQVSAAVFFTRGPVVELAVA